MRMPTEKSVGNETRRGSKPLVEKKRRARINKSLAELQTLVMDCQKKKGGNFKQSRIEKADILEMTVRYLQTLQKQKREAVSSSVYGKFRSGYLECVSEVSRYLTTVEKVESHVHERLRAHLLLSMHRNLMGANNSEENQSDGGATAEEMKTDSDDEEEVEQEDADHHMNYTVAPKEKEKVKHQSSSGRRKGGGQQSGGAEVTSTTTPDPPPPTSSPSSFSSSSEFESPRMTPGEVISSCTNPPSPLLGLHPAHPSPQLIHQQPLSVAGVALIPRRLPSGQLAFIVPPPQTQEYPNLHNYTSVSTAYFGPPTAMYDQLLSHRQRPSSAAFNVSYQQHYAGNEPVWRPW